MERTQFTFYASFFTAIRRIRKKADRADAYDAICAYALTGKEPEMEKLPDAAAIAFDLIRPNLDSSRRKAKNGKLGGSKPEAEPKPHDGMKEAERKQEKRATEKENEKEIEKEIEIENECYPPTPLPVKQTSRGKREKQFIPPTLDEVRAYCLERKNNVDPERFFDYFDASGWVDSEGKKVRNWKQKVITWESNGKKIAATDTKRENGFETSNPFLEMLNERMKQQ